MKLSKLLKEFPFLEVHGNRHVEITGIATHSKSVSPGALFIARKGMTKDGSDYIPEAIRGGASAIITDIFNPSLPVTQVIYADPASLEAPLAVSYYQDPSKKILMVGITGTKGKTTTSYLIQHLLSTLGKPSGLIGTIEYNVGGNRYPATHTTPDAVANQRMLCEMVQNGCQAAVMEVSSHGLAQKRVKGIHYDIAVFTNLTPDHLDFHPTMEHYVHSKSLLFRSLEQDKKAVINQDASYHDAMTRECAASLLTYGIVSEADLRASSICLSPDRTTFLLSYQGKEISCNSPLLGYHNVYNVLAALGAGLCAGYSLESLVVAIEQFTSVPGRLEKVENGCGIHVYIDFAHSGNALQEVLKSLQSFKTGRILVVFGAGGDRDPGRRTGMARAAQQYADIAIITTDNPRSEDPEKIIQEIVSGFKTEENVYIYPDRKEAIQVAIEMAREGDIVLIAGKGHEKTQIFAHQTIEFDDCKVAKEACEKIIICR